jgi:hypothetical protein
MLHFEALPEAVWAGKATRQDARQRAHSSAYPQRKWSVIGYSRAGMMHREPSAHDSHWDVELLDTARLCRPSSSASDWRV